MKLLDLLDHTPIYEEDSKTDIPTHPPYPGQSSGRLKKFVNRHYGGKLTCAKAARVENDPDANNFYKKRAAWYKNLHCNGRKKVKEDDLENTESFDASDIDTQISEALAKLSINIF